MGDSAWRKNDPWDPRNPENRDRTRPLVHQLRSRLLVWDPIGVADAPEAQDEYDCLISPLMHRLSDGESATAIGDWLIEELRDHFGMSADATRERSLAAELKQWWNEATTSA
jgi:hypothetical protein